jgi:hypothetical protein
MVEGGQLDMDGLAGLGVTQAMDQWHQHAVQQRVLAGQQVGGAPGFGARQASGRGLDGWAGRSAPGRGRRDLHSGVVVAASGLPAFSKLRR